MKIIKFALSLVSIVLIVLGIMFMVASDQQLEYCIPQIDCPDGNETFYTYWFKLVIIKDVGILETPIIDEQANLWVGITFTVVGALVLVISALMGRKSKKNK